MKARRLSTILTMARLAAMLALVVAPLRSAPATPLSEAQLTKIVNAIAKTEKVAFLIPEAAISLGLPKDQKTTFKFRSFTTPDGVNHIFSKLNTQNGYIVFKRTADNLLFLRVDADLQLVAAATETPAIPNSIRILPLREAANQLDQELAAWANYADNSMDKTPETPIGNK